MVAKKALQAERRAEPRARLERIFVRIHVQGRVEPGHLINLNNIGAYIATAAVLGEGTPIALEIDVPSSGRLPLLHARVVRSKGATLNRGDDVPAGIAVKFLAETAEGRSRIHLAVRTALALDLLDDRPRKRRVMSEETVRYRR